MTKLDNEKLDTIYGGETLSGAVISALTGVVKILYDAGVSFGSSLRRLIDGSLCPLK